MSTDREVIQQMVNLGNAQLGVPVTPPVVPVDPTTPTTPLPPTQPGNSGAIIPVPNPWNAVIPANGHERGSGAIAAYAIPLEGRASKQFTQGQTPASGANTVSEFQVSRTPGVIDPAAPNYYKTSQMQNQGVTLYNSLPAGLSVDYITGSGAFWAPATEGPWFVNVRWTTPSGQAAFSIQWQDGPW